MLEKMPFAYPVQDFDYMMAINDQKTRIFEEGGLVFKSKHCVPAFPNLNGSIFFY